MVAGVIPARAGSVRHSRWLAACLHLYAMKWKVLQAEVNVWALNMVKASNSVQLILVVVVGVATAFPHTPRSECRLLDGSLCTPVLHCSEVKCSLCCGAFLEDLGIMQGQVDQSTLPED